MTPLIEALLYTDGAARGNPGPAPAGYRITAPTGELVEAMSELLGVATNNQAEYAALIRGLRACVALGVRRVRWTSDSELVVKQLTGENRVKAPALDPPPHRPHRAARTSLRSAPWRSG